MFKGVDLRFLHGGLLSFGLAAVISFNAPCVRSQDLATAAKLDPARDGSRLTVQEHRLPLTEQYIWTGVERRGSAASAGPWIFRRTFQLQTVPSNATLYVAVAGDAGVWVNGKHLLEYHDDRRQRAGYTVHAIDAAATLKSGDNVVVVQITDLHGAHHTTTDPLVLQFVGGKALAVKLLAAGRGVQTPPLMVSDEHWLGRASSAGDRLAEISQSNYDAMAWPQARSLGGIESNNAFFQWNADAGMYDWPGYVGTSPALRHYVLRPVKIIDEYDGSSVLEDVESLTGPASSANQFRVRRSPDGEGEQSPTLMLDFGKEVAGRIHLRSEEDAPVRVIASYGESEQEASYEPFLCARAIYIPPHGEAWGPKSGFRYVKLRFLSDARFSAIDLDGIAYPVDYKGSFVSSDALLNQIWETGAYTTHLCMQDGIWDGVKRDRARWAGDLDISGRVISDVFANRELMEDTLNRLIDETDGMRHVNGIDGYSALWISSVTEFYRHTGDRVFLDKLHPKILALLHTMDRDLDSDGVFVPQSGEHVFVDWSPGLSADTAESRRATSLEYLLAYKEAAWLLTQLDDHAQAKNYTDKFNTLRRSVRSKLMDSTTKTFGSLWQTNAMAVLSGAAEESDYPALWERVFANIDEVNATSAAITPFFGYYVLEALASMGHRTEAMQWLRDYWGGMVAEGATTFWESYDPRWTKKNFHSGLQADGLAGYYVSLAHAWSSGPTSWMQEQMLGVRATDAGFHKATIQPELAGLKWLEGSVPTPHGVIRVRAEENRIVVDLPDEVAATLSFRASEQAHVEMNGVGHESQEAPIKGYRQIELDHAGHYEIVIR
jgi:alpha-L-rhamnosidase